ncbi:DUF6157 family protein [Azospirillum sp. 11R-A]|uniref:DUF6157 family protein n=1 Tax=Azospirillum sp. 11R-A TaxID=3111634 RepID=UPI003C14CB50
MSTNYIDTFITVSADCKAKAGTVPPKAGTIGALQLSLLLERPYGLTSEELLLEVHMIRNGIPPADREAARESLFAKPQACLRTSPLVKSYGWGLHHDGTGRVAAHAVESGAYRDLSTRPDLTVVAGMRNGRG